MAALENECLQTELKENSDGVNTKKNANLRRKRILEEGHHDGAFVFLGDAAHNDIVIIVALVAVLCKRGEDPVGRFGELHTAWNEVCYRRHRLSLVVDFLG
jgi:hypothetical protein